MMQFVPDEKEICTKFFIITHAAVNFLQKAMYALNLNFWY